MNIDYCLEDGINICNVGNILIKFDDAWGQSYYLTDSLKFTSSRANASKFYLLKSGTTSILNGDYVTINSGNKILVINNDRLSFIDKNNLDKEETHFIITNNNDIIDPIAFNTTINFITNKNLPQSGLKLSWDLKKQAAVLENSVLTTEDDFFFHFSLERVDLPITTYRTLTTKKKSTEDSPVIALTKAKKSLKSTLLEKYAPGVLLVFFIVLIFVCASFYS